MASTATGHKQDTSRGTKPVKIDEDLWQQCRAIKASWEGKLPAWIGTVDGCEVYVVDALKIMVDHDMDFTQAGNGLEDPKLCAKNEIVVDNRVNPSDWCFDVLHEAVERRHMLKGLGYDAAHKKANAMEMEVRKRWLREHGSTVRSSSTSSIMR